MAEKNVKTVYKLKWKSLGILAGILILTIMIIIGIFFGYNFFKDLGNTKDSITKINESIVVKNIVDDEFTRTIAPDSTLSKFDIYWDYIKLGLIDVDMASLKKINADSVGYIEVKGTSFKYPVLENKNNFYRTHSFDKKENSNGWIYLDKNNNFDELDTNTIIYGNKVFGDVLFGNLNVLFKESWNSNDDNHIIKYSTNNYSTLWQIISVFKTDNSDYLRTTFANESETDAYIDLMVKNSEIKFKSTARNSDKFLTLTTNSSGSNTVVFAKLIKIREEKS